MMRAQTTSCVSPTAKVKGPVESCIRRSFPPVSSQPVPVTGSPGNWNVVTGWKGSSFTWSGEPSLFRPFIRRYASVGVVGSSPLMYLLNDVSPRVSYTPGEDWTIGPRKKSNPIAGGADPYTASLFVSL